MKAIARTLCVLISLWTAPAILFAQSYTLNLKNADISALINTVSELTGKNFVVDPRVKGKVTVISAHPMEKEEIYQVFLSILEVHGFSTIPSGDVIKVVPEVKAKQANIPLSTGNDNIPGDQMVTRIIQVKNVAAAQLVPILRPLIPQQGHMAAYPSTNVLIISDRAANVTRITSIIERIDQVSDSDVDIIPLENAAAADVVRVITALQQKTGQKTGANNGIKLAADERTNSILLSGERTARAKLHALIAKLDMEQESGGNTHVVYLHYAKAKDLVPVLTGVSTTIEGEQKQGSSKSPRSTPIDIQADEMSNALVITAPPDIYRSLKTVISQLDIRRAQVLVEAIIAEIAINKTKELGVEWIIDGRGGNGPVGIVNFGSASGIANIAATVAAGGAPTIKDGATLGLGQFSSGSLNFAALLHALEGDATSNILSTPSLMTLDNQKAEIIIGQNVPFVTGEYSNSGSSSSSVNPFRTIQREDVGLTLRVTPQINEGDSVKLEIEQEVSSLSSSTISATDLITNKRVIKTTVMVQDGKTIILGGLLDENLQQTDQKVPVLGDIPIFGNLFKSKGASTVRRNLMVFLRPTILRDAATETQLTNSKYSYLRAEQLKIRQQNLSLFPSTYTPVLPKRFIDLPLPFEGMSDHSLPSEK